MKPAIKTTEFWLVLGAAVAAVAMTHFEQADGTTAVVVTAALAALHSLLRAALKSKAGQS